MHSANTGPELSQWLRWASERGNTPMFVRTVAEAARMACIPDYVLLRPVLAERKRRYPEGLAHRKIKNVRISWQPTGQAITLRSN
jgi:hypothetical protein